MKANQFKKHSGKKNPSDELKQKNSGNQSGSAVINPHNPLTGRESKYPEKELQNKNPDLKENDFEDSDRERDTQNSISKTPDEKNKLKTKAEINRRNVLADF